MSANYKVSGKKFALPAAPAGFKFIPRPGGWIVVERPDGTRERVALFESRGNLSVSIGGKLLHGQVAAEGRRSEQGSSGGDSDLVAQFPGKVRKILVADGARVKEGDPLVLVEAMKMEFAVKAGSAGTVKRVLVKEGQQLSPGDRFLDFEESPS